MFDSPADLMCSHDYYDSTSLWNNDTSISSYSDSNEYEKNKFLNNGIIELPISKASQIENKFKDYIYKQIMKDESQKEYVYENISKFIEKEFNKNISIDELKKLMEHLK